MHVPCFPFRLNANTANTHHQALEECRAKGSGELKVEAKQQSSLMLLEKKKKKKAHPLSIIGTALVFFVNGAIFSLYFHFIVDYQCRFGDFFAALSITFFRRQ